MAEYSTAVHEAAHSVIHFRLLGIAVPITIIRNTEEGYEGAAETDLGTPHPDTDAEIADASVLLLYAGGHAQRRADPHGGPGTASDEEDATDWLNVMGWTAREQEFRTRSRELVLTHWAEIEAVASEVMTHLKLDAEEVEEIARAATGDADADVEEYRRLRRLLTQPREKP